MMTQLMRAVPFMLDWASTPDCLAAKTMMFPSLALMAALNRHHPADDEESPDEASTTSLVLSIFLPMTERTVASVMRIAELFDIVTIVVPR